MNMFSAQIYKDMEGLHVLVEGLKEDALRRELDYLEARLNEIASNMLVNYVMNHGMTVADAQRRVDKDFARYIGETFQWLRSGNSASTKEEFDKTDADPAKAIGSLADAMLGLAEATSRAALSIVRFRDSLDDALNFYANAPWWRKAAASFLAGFGSGLEWAASRLAQRAGSGEGEPEE